MKNKLTRKLMLSAFTLLFAVISLGASTYAWFVMSEDANVDAFYGKVTAGESGLEIAVDLIREQPASAASLTWHSTELNIADYLNDYLTVDEADNNKKKFQFDAVSNVLGFNNTAESFKKLNTNGELSQATANQDYIAFRLYFRLADTTGIPEGGRTVYLTNYDLTTDGTPSAWYVNKEYISSLGGNDKISVGDENITYKVSDAARIAFVPETVNTAYTKEIFEAKGIENTKTSSYGNDKVGAYDYYNKVKSDVLEDIYPGKDYITTSKSLENAKAIGALGVDGDNLTFVDVYVWIDGWDNECINAIFNQTLKVVLSFSLNSTNSEEE